MSKFASSIAKKVGVILAVYLNMSLNRNASLFLVLSLLVAIAITGLGLYADPVGRYSCPLVFKPLNLDMVKVRGLELEYIPPTQGAFYEYRDNGVHLAFGMKPKKGKAGQFELSHFGFVYNPRMFLPGSFFRQVLGSFPMKYALDDLRLFTFHTEYKGMGSVVEFYLRSSEDKNKVSTEGPLLVVSLNTGLIRGYSAGTNVEASINGIRQRDLGSVFSFTKGLFVEAQNLLKNPVGQWYLEKNKESLR